jgi:hypothetical protein
MPSRHPRSGAQRRPWLAQLETGTRGRTPTVRRLTDVDQTDILSEAPHGSSAQTTQSHVHSTWGFA